jgi:hypothetical protein
MRPCCETVIWGYSPLRQWVVYRDVDSDLLSEAVFADLGMEVEASCRLCFVCKISDGERLPFRKVRSE